MKDIKSGATTLASYVYDLNSNLTTRTVNTSPSTHTTYLYDPLDRVTWMTHYLNGTSRGFNYGYYDDSNNRKYVRRTGSTLGDVGDVFSYDLADQAIGVQLNVATPQSTPPPPQTILYDSNGNRTSFHPYGPTETYTINNNSLNQYSTRNGTNAAYDAKGDLTTGFDGSTYGYDAQNRLTSATKSGVTMSFKYDGLNRQVSRTIGGTTTYSVWDGWNLVAEYQNPATVLAGYVHGPTGLVKEMVNNRYYYQDGSGSTSHLASSTGQLLWWFRYDLDGNTDRLQFRRLSNQRQWL